MKRGSTILLKATIILLGIVVLAFCFFVLPQMWKGGSIEFPEASDALLLIVVGLYITAVPFFVALWQAMKLLKYIDKNIAFSNFSVKALKNIKYCAITIGILYMAGVPFLLPIVEADDAPGILVIGFIFVCAPFVVAVFVAVLQRLLQNAIDIKSENDLTV